MKQLIPKYKREHLSREELELIASEITEVIKSKKLLIWQAKEVLELVKDEIEWSELK